MLIQIHILQNYAPANLNRDETGSPKDAMLGGFRRSRISSQCLKRSIRKSEVFKEAFANQALLGERTQKLPDLLDEELQRLGVDEETRRNLLTRVSEIGRESKKKGGDKKKDQDDLPDEGGEAPLSLSAESETKQLIFIGKDELRPMAEKLLGLYKQLGSKGWAAAPIDKITAALGGSVPRSVDIAMFGRMTTSNAFVDVQAAVQVAHAISTNALEKEFDYYTAVDDLTNESGASMIGDIEFNSSTYYKYFNIHWEELVKNLGDDRELACQATLALLEAAATAHPSGKQNSFASFCLPDLVLVEVSKRNLPINYANAFLKPARPSSSASLVEVSTQKLAEHVEKLDRAYNLDNSRAFFSLDSTEIPKAEALTSLNDLKAWLEEKITG